MADNGAGPVGGTGTLFGAKDLQHSIDALAHQLGTMNTLLAKQVGSVSSSSARGSISTTPGSTGVPSAGPIASRWNQLSNWVGGQAGGKGNGGNAGFGGIPINPGGASGGGGQAFSEIGAGISLLRVGASYGGAKLPGQVSMDTFASYAAMSMNGGATWSNKAAMLRQTFGGGGRNYNSYGLNQTDIMQGELMRQQIAGTPYLNTQRGQVTAAGMAQFGITNPTLGAVGAASVMQNLYSAPSFYRAMATGMPTALGAGGRMTSPSQLATQIMQATFQGRGTVSSAELNAALGQNGSLTLNMAQQGYSQDTINAMGDLMRAKNNALQRGMTGSEFDTLVSQAGRGSQASMQAAQKKLADVGLNYASLQSLKNGKASGNAADADINGAFSKSVAKATNDLAKFSSLLERVVAKPWAKQLLGSAGGMGAIGSVIDGVTTALGMPNPISGITGILSGNSNTASMSAGGGSNSSSTSGSGSGKSTASVGQALGAMARSAAGSVTAAEVIKTAETQIGVPYHLGMETPYKGFDCGSLLQWAYGQHGIRIERYVPSLWAQTKKNAVNVKDTQPGDLLFRADNGHVTMKISDKQIIEAPHTGAFVRIRSFNAGEWDHASRVVGSVGVLGQAPSDASQTPQAMSQQGNTGSPGVGGGAGAYGSTEEIDAVLAGLSAMPGGSIGSGASASGNSQGSANAGNGGSGGSTAKAPTTVSGNVALGKQMAAKVGWTGAEWDALYQLWQHESGWRTTVKNYQGSGAYGIPQSLPASKMASAGSDYLTNPATQIKWGLNYIKQRYGDPETAWKDWQARYPHWYDKGAWKIEKDEAAVVHRDEMIIPAKQAETIRQALTTDAYFKKGIPGGSSGNSGNGGGVTLHFDQGSIVIQANGALDDVTARSAARSFADELTKKKLYNQIAAGVTSVSA